MARMVHCIKLGREAEGLDKPPLKGDVGKKIFENVSKEAWKSWLEHSKMLINEFRLDLMSESGQRIWMTEMDKYFYGEGSKLPEQFVNPGDKPADEPNKPAAEPNKPAAEPNKPADEPNKPG